MVYDTRYRVLHSIGLKPYTWSSHFSPAHTVFSYNSAYRVYITEITHIQKECL